MEEDISSGKFFQGQYFNELLNNDFILEAHSIFILNHTQTIVLPDFGQQKTNAELQLGEKLWEAARGWGIGPSPGPG